MSGNANVLVVEDYDELRYVCAKLLRKAGYFVSEAVNADDALRVVASRKIDVVVTDIRMPGTIDGWGLAAKLKAMVPPVKVICVTAYAREYEGRVNCDEFLPKPFNFDDLFRALDKLLAA